MSKAMKTFQNKQEITLLTLLFALVNAGQVEGQQGGLRVNQQVEACLHCHVAVVQTMSASGGTSSRYRCRPYDTQQSDTLTYTLNLPEQFVQANKVKLDSGLSNICITGGTAIPPNAARAGIIVIPPNAEISFVTRSNRANLSQRPATTGTRSLLVVRVTTPSSIQSLSAATIANATFGTGGQQISMASQFRSCSASKLNIIPATSSTGKIIDGVLDLNLPTSVNNTDMFTLESIMTTMVRSALNVASLESSFSHVMFCMPQGIAWDVNGPKDWVAYGYLNDQYSYFNDGYCRKLSQKMHEIGHNLGLQHSGEGGDPYGDLSDVMGYSYRAADFPVMCFNGHKNYVLGWYAEKQIIVDPKSNGPWCGNLVGFVDYAKAVTSRDEYVLIVVGNLHIQYNLAEGANFQTQEKANMVTIVSAANNTDESTMVGALSATQSITIGLYTIEVVSMIASTDSSPKSMRISIRLATQSFSCSAIAQIPSTSQNIFAKPTAWPTSSKATTNPTSWPTRKPTRRPTATPTNGSTPKKTGKPNRQLRRKPTPLLSDSEASM